jgi:uncharacterized protein (DUF169 family)
VLDVKTLNKIGEDIVRILRVRTIPVGILFFKNPDDIPEEFQIIEKKKSFCSIVGLSRFYEIPVAITEEYIGGLCGGLDLPFGFGKRDPSSEESLVGYFGETLKDVQGIFSDMLFMKERIRAFGIAPITIINTIPDIVMIWGNPAQMSTLAYAHTWHSGGKRIRLATNGHGGSCYEALVVPYVKDEVTLTLADAGDRRHGYAGDDDMIMSVPTGKMEALYDGFIKNQQTRHGTPTVYNFDDLPFPIPPEAMAKKLSGIR